MIKANDLRKTVLRMVYAKNSGHISSCFSIAELVATLYNECNFDTNDKLILSKGHAVPILYAAMYAQGRLTDQQLDTFREVDSQLQGHPDMVRCKYIHATTGSLGQGLSIAIGHAMGMKLKKSPGTAYCIIGDGEAQEGQCMEALFYAGKQKVDNLTCFVDFNGYQSDIITDTNFYVNTLPKIADSLGWITSVIDGHDIHGIQRVLRIIPGPRLIILRTIKGKGLSFLEGKNCHGYVPTKEEYELGLKELA